MHIRRPTIIITAILALALALAAVSGSAIATAVRHVPSTHVQVVGTGSSTMLHG
jgi:hypothetical protein